SYPASGIRHPASGIRHLASGIWHHYLGRSLFILRNADDLFYTFQFCELFGVRLPGSNYAKNGPLHTRRTVNVEIL
ncbi:MAG TPA: hypothetical protein VMY18_07955, partial [Acidobacteriota bacterium]|nr:hypothetical protein [Acidobacteriota bacterium]